MTQKLFKRFCDIETENSNCKNLYKVSGTASLMLGMLFLISALGFIISIIWTGNDRFWVLLPQNNWLIEIFKIHAGFTDIHNNPLYGLNFLDIIILVLFSLMSFGLSITLNKSGKRWSILAFILSLIAIILFIATQIAGRCTVMLSVIIFSIVMLRYKIYNKVTIYTGILAGIFLFLGDLSVGVHSTIITILFGIGFMLLTLWFFLIARTQLKFK